MPLDVDPRRDVPRVPTDWNPDDRNPCRDCTPENCEWFGICPHTPTKEGQSDGQQ